MSLRERAACAAVCLSATLAWGQSRDPKIGYLYPAGAKQGTTVRVLAGGQYLQGPIDVHVSGQGVRAKVTRYFRPLFNIMPEQRYVLTKSLLDVRQKRLKEAGVSPAVLKRLQEQGERALAWAKRRKLKIDDAKMPEHPLLYELDSKSLAELAHLRTMIFFPRQKRQINRQLMESVMIEVTVDADAAPGRRELRLRARGGLTNPVVFQVGQFPEVSELEPNDRKGGPDLKRIPMLGNLPHVTKLLARTPVDVPAVLNGQIMPGDVDRWQIRVKKGQPLVIRAHARRLIPYLADAVPGWFQATVAIYDEKGNEVAFADDYRFDPDPVLLARAPRDGVYELEIRDAIHRGREDFVYRIEIGPLPFVTSVFPLGGRAGKPAKAAIDGWNLSARQVALDTTPGEPWLRKATTQSGDLVSNSIVYAVDTLPECFEREPNDGSDTAQAVATPIIVNGRVATSGDVDVFRLDGQAGGRVVIEVFARRLNSPMDSLVRLFDARGKLVAWNDDHVHKDEHLHMDRLGYVTHHADSYLTAELPESGTYYVQLSDAQHHGSAAHAYRLRISPPRPDFALRATPSSLSLRPGAIVPITVYALRKDGFEGAIDVRVTSPQGFVLQGGRIPAGQNSARMTLTAGPRSSGRIVPLQLEGVARTAEGTLRRPAQGADNLMQAFLWRHLLPAEQMMVSVIKQRWPVPPIRVAGQMPVRIPLGGSRRVRVQTRPSPAMKQMVLALDNPPAGVALREVKTLKDGFELYLTADASTATCGPVDNLIVQAFREFVPKDKDGKPRGGKRRWPMGFLPAIPAEIVQK